MSKLDAKWGWALAIAGIALLVVLGQASLLIVLVPTALVLACGLVWVAQRLNHVTHGIK